MASKRPDDAVAVAEVFERVARSLAGHDDVQTTLQGIVDLAADDRWPDFAGRAHRETGVASILSVRLFIEHDTMGALNLYARERDAFDETDVALAAVFAAHAAVALSAARKEAQLEAKATSRDLIGQAKGILMARGSIDEDEAFEILRRASRRLNRKLVEVADDVVNPPPAPGPP